MIIIDKAFKGIRPLLICFAVWVGLCSLALLLMMKLSYLLGFLLGAVGSVLYVALLCRRVIFMVEDSAVDAATVHSPQPVWQKLLSKDMVKRLWQSWTKGLQPVAFILVIILWITHVAQISFLAALIGFFSFQVSIFLYTAMLSMTRLLE